MHSLFLSPRAGFGGGAAAEMGEEIQKRRGPLQLGSQDRPSLFLASLISRGLADRQHGAESVLSPWPSHSIPKAVLICCYYGNTAGFIRAAFVAV